MTRRDAPRGAKRNLTVVEESEPKLRAPQSEHTDAEPSAVRALMEKRRTGPKGPPLELTMDEKGTLDIGYCHADEKQGHVLLMADVGSASTAFFNGLICQIALLGSPGKRVDEAASNFVLSVVQTVKPQDELEAMLAAQMGAVHAATMVMARRLNHVDLIDGRDSTEHAMNELARTFATQMDTLKRYRTGGGQSTTVERVRVNEGGQAIVGNVTHDGPKAPR